MNKVILIGNLTRDPEMRSFSSGKTVTSFTIAVQRRFRSQNDTQEADFINCEAWDQTGQFVSKYFQKGSKIGIVGRLRTRPYEDKNGNRRTAYEVIVESAEFVTSKAQNPAAQREYSAPDVDRELTEDRAPTADELFGEDLEDFQPLDDSKLPF